MKPDGSGERILTEGFHNESPTWAPNGQYIMFFRDPGGQAGGKLYMVDITGRVEQPVPTPSFASDPTWSPLLSESAARLRRAIRRSRAFVRRAGAACAGLVLAALELEGEDEEGDAEDERIGAEPPGQHHGADAAGRHQRARCRTAPRRCR